MQEFESFLASLMLACMPTSKEATATLNANTQKNIRSEVKKLENQMIEATTRPLTSHQIFLKETKGNATNFKLIRPKALKR
ncbi:hypothetical protein Taitung203_11640 [Helicobacter pylori]